MVPGKAMVDWKYTKKAELSEDQHFDLYEFCESTNIKFLTSVFNDEDIPFF